MSSILDYQSPPPPKSLVSRITGLFQRRATWVLFDQGFVSLGNFLTVNFLARWLITEQFGLFSVLLETMLYLNSLQAALVIYPLNVRGAKGDRAMLGRIATASIFMTLLLLPILGAAMGGVVLAGGTGISVVTAVAALTLWQIQETTRRALMADLRFGEAILGDAISYLGQAGLILLMHHYGKLTLNTAYLSMALSSSAAICVQALQVGLKPVNREHFKELIAEFWVLGRWMLLNNASGLISGLAYWYVLKWTHGDADCAAFGVIVAMMKLANPVMVSIGNLIVPAVSRLHEHEGIRAARRIALRYTAFGAVLLGPFFLVVFIAPELMLKLFYGWGTPYVEHATALRLFVLNYTMAYVGAALGAWLAGLGHSRLSFYTQAVNVITTLAVGLPMTWAWGVMGLVVGGMLAVSSAALACVYYVWMLMRKQMA